MVLDSTKEQLMAAATKLFAQKGLEGTTVREIAQAAGVNVSLVSYHFDGKEGLYRACLESYGQSRLASSERLAVTPKSREEMRIRLEMFVDDLFESFLREPEISAIVQRECERGDQVNSDLFKKVFLKIHENLVKFVEAGKKAGFVSPDIDASLIGPILVGPLTHAMRMDRVIEKVLGHSLKQEKYRRKFKDQLLRVICGGILTN